MELKIVSIKLKSLKGLEVDDKTIQFLFVFLLHLLILFGAIVFFFNNSVYAEIVENIPMWTHVCLLSEKRQFTEKAGPAQVAFARAESRSNLVGLKLTTKFSKIGDLVTNLCRKSQLVKTDANH